MTSSGIPTFGGEHVDPVAAAPTAGRPVRQRNGPMWNQRHVVAPNATAGDTDLCVSREEI